MYDDHKINEAFNDMESGDYKSTEAKIDLVFKKTPDHPEALHVLGILRVKQGRLREAETCLSKALDTINNPTGVLHDLAHVLTIQRKGHELLEVLRKLLNFEKTSGNHLKLAELLLKADNLEDLQEAKLNIQEAIEMEPSSLQPKILLIKYYELIGDITKADKLIDDLYPYYPNDDFMFYKHIEKLYHLGVPLSENMEKVLSDIEEKKRLYEQHWSTRSRMAIDRLLGSLYEKLGKIDHAFKKYEEANRISASRYDRSEISVAFKNLTTKIKQPYRVKNQTHAVPCHVFIVGMPRSGSTLVERILSSDERVQSLGETGALYNAINDNTQISSLGEMYKISALSSREKDLIRKQYLEEWNTNSKVLLNKNLINYVFMGAIMLFPNAKVIHMARKPLETMLSCYANFFEGKGLGYTNDLKDLGWYYAQYMNLMQHWESILGNKLLSVNYEEVAAGNDEVVKRLFSFCGLDYNEKWQDFYKSEGVTRTASYRQVRQPLTKSAINRAAPFKKYLKPALKEMKRFLNK